MTKSNARTLRLMALPLIAGAVMASQGFAQTTESGPYVSGGIGTVNSKKADVDITTLNGRAGYQVNRYFAVEGEATFGIDDDKTPAGTYKLTDKVGAYAVGKVPVSDKVSLIGRAGLSDTRLKKPAGVTKVENGTSRDLGVGAEVALSPGLALRGDYTHSEFLGKNGRSDNLGVNLVKKF